MVQQSVCTPSLFTNKMILPLFVKFGFCLIKKPVFTIMVRVGWCDAVLVPCMSSLNKPLYVAIIYRVVFCVSPCRCSADDAQSLSTEPVHAEPVHGIQHEPNGRHGGHEQLPESLHVAQILRVNAMLLCSGHTRHTTSLPLNILVDNIDFGFNELTV